MQHKQASKRDYLLFAVLVLVVFGAIGFSLYRGQVAILFRGLEPSCVIGISTASITVQAWSANDDCQAMLAGPNNFTGYNWTKLGGSLVSASSGTIMCEMDMGDRHVTVRDGTPASNNGTITCMILNGTMPAGTLPQ